jgi:NADPH-dependent ferric siderophore reductase
MTTTASPALPMILAEVDVVSVERLSPTYVRVELGGAALADFGVAGPLLDQRIKLVFPGDSGALPSVAGADASWYAKWRALSSEVAGHMRTYTVRFVRGSGAGTRLVVDFVLHLEPGATGPGSAWASRARVGDRLVILAPRRGEPFGGIEFAPGDARVLLVAADETAVPAACSILEGLPATAVGAAFLEVPLTADVQEVRRPPGVDVVWLARDGAPLGERLRAAVLGHLGVEDPVEDSADDLVEAVAPAEVDPDLWETPTYSSSGQEVAAPAGSAGVEGLYAWVAGESGVVTALRRTLVRDLGMDRRQVAFMGYWRRGVAMGA